MGLVDRRGEASAGTERREHDTSCCSEAKKKFMNTFQTENIQLLDNNATRFHLQAEHLRSDVGALAWWLPCSYLPACDTLSRHLSSRE